MKRKLALLLALLVAVILTVPAAAAVPAVISDFDVEDLDFDFEEVVSRNLFVAPGGLSANFLDDYPYYMVFLDMRLPATPLMHFMYASNPVVSSGDRFVRFQTSELYGWNVVRGSENNVFRGLSSGVVGDPSICGITTQHNGVGIVYNTHFGYYMERYSTACFEGTYEQEDVAPWIVGEPRQPPVIVDISALVALIAQARVISNDGYTEASWSILQSSITSAQALLDSGTYTQDQVDASYSRLSNAISSLSLVPVDPPPVDPGDHRYLADGIRISDLLPMQEAITENLLFAIKNGILLCAILLGIWLVPRVLRRFRGGPETW